MSSYALILDTPTQLFGASDDFSWLALDLGQRHTSPMTPTVNLVSLGVSSLLSAHAGAPATFQTLGTPTTLDTAFWQGLTSRLPQERYPS